MKYLYCIPAALVAAVVSVGAVAKVGPAELAKLGKELTPIGAEKAGNADGSIPAWNGGLTQPPAGYKGTGTRYINPFPEDKPAFTITKANLAQYQSRLSAGQLALFEKFPDSYKMPVYNTRRTFANPQFIYDATLKNAANATLEGNGEALAGASVGIPFPIPKNGHEVIWNHKVRFRDVSLVRWNNQFAVTTGGDFNGVKIREDVKFTYSEPGATPESLNNVLFYFLQVTTAPPRLAGTILLVHETMDQVKEARRAWQYNPGQKRLRRAPNVGYDNPGTASDGLRTNDQTDTYNGAMDRYDWKLLGKQEMYVPANSYVQHVGPVQVQGHRQEEPHQPGPDALRAAPPVGGGGQPAQRHQPHLQEAPLLRGRGRLADPPGGHLRRTRPVVALPGNPHRDGLRQALREPDLRDRVRPAEQPLSGAGPEQRRPGERGAGFRRALL
jgi:hypothetical protein